MAHRFLITAALVAVIVAVAISIVTIERLATNLDDQARTRRCASLPDSGRGISPRDFGAGVTGQWPVAPPSLTALRGG